MELSLLRKRHSLSCQSRAQKLSKALGLTMALQLIPTETHGGCWDGAEAAAAVWRGCFHPHAQGTALWVVCLVYPSRARARVCVCVCVCVCVRERERDRETEKERESCPRAGSDSQGPTARVTSAASCPRRPQPAPTDSHHVLASLMGSVPLVCGPLSPCRLLLSQQCHLFHRALHSHDVSKVGQLRFGPFCPRPCSRLRWLWDPLIFAHWTTRFW